jgi:hypothetical protein
MLNTILDNLVLLLPLLVIQLGLMIFCVVKILKEGVGNLNKAVWLLIVIFINLFGPILYLIVGRKRDGYDSGE